jgi:hypothetical protein
MVHVNQARRMGTIITNYKYMIWNLIGYWHHRDWDCAYYHNPMEVEAYRVQYGDDWQPECY